MMMRLCERPYTGQLLSEKFGISRAKIHYHLKELEKKWLYRNRIYRRKKWHRSKILS
ncbi:Transcriptional regulator, ArsR family [Bacillus cereus]|nr:Transcriptional regulator, ArsR family [Bacillus cereus]